MAEPVDEWWKPDRGEPLSKPGEDFTDNPLTVIEGWFRGIIRQEIQAVRQNGHQGGDHLLDVESASKLLSVDESWLYRHQKKLPFTRKLAPRVLRFSYQGIQEYLASRKN